MTARPEVAAIDGAPRAFHLTAKSRQVNFRLGFVRSRTERRRLARLARRPLIAGFTSQLNGRPLHSRPLDYALRLRESHRQFRDHVV
jgi:hypothetical protein